MLPLFLVLLSFGSYSSSAPVVENLRGLIKETLQNLDTVQESEDSFNTPANIMVDRCILKNMNTFIESVNSSNTNLNIKQLLLKLEATRLWLKVRQPNLKESQADCAFAKQNFEHFKKELKHFLSFINEYYGRSD